jgi:predicted MPP superfamily phosphohydrolase
MVNALDPDLIVWTGDYIAGPFADPEPAIAAARAFLGSLRARYGVVAIPGHSEPERIRSRVVAGFDHVHYLVDEELALELPDGRRLRIFGASAERPRLDRLEPDGDPALVTIAATHVPDLSGELDGKEVELHLAGHTHGGQIAFPVLGPPVTLSRLPKRFARGLHRFGDHWLHVTPGIGMEGHHAPRIRFLCPPEIDLLLIAGGGEPLEPLARPVPRQPWWESWRPNRRSPTLAAQPRGDARGGR